MEKPIINIQNLSFPNQQASDEEKKTEAYGLSVGRAIESEWFRQTGGSCRFYNQHSDFHNTRLYARGEQSIQQYKNLLAVNGDMSHLNLDWSIIPIMPKFVDVLVNGMNDRLYKIKVESQDVMSAEKKNIFQDMVEVDMNAKDFLAQTKEQFGVDINSVPQDDIPETEEELSLYMQLKYKPSIEIAEETAIDSILSGSNYSDHIKPKINYDLAVLGIGGAKHSFNTKSGAIVEYVDPASCVWSYTEMDDFHDCFYFGEVKQVHYTELRKINPNLTDDQLNEAKRIGAAWINHFPAYNNINDSAFNNEVVNILYFNYKTESRHVYKKKNLENGGSKVIRKDGKFNPPKEDAELFQRVDNVIDVWYDGALILGSNIIVKWELLKNMVRPKAASQKVVANYVFNAPRMYKGIIESSTKRMIPFANQLQLTGLKMQQVKSRIVPDGVFIDADGLNEVDLGTGAAYGPEEALKLYFQTGSVIGRSQTVDGEFNNARIPIQELTSNSGQSKMNALINDYQYNLNMIRDCIGINEARDGSTPNPDALVGVQKMAALSSNTATNHILRAGLRISKDLAYGLSLRISDILEYSDFKEEFAMQIGKYNVAILNDIKDLYLYSFGMFIELEPDEEQKAQLEANIQMALSQGQIDLEDAIDLRHIKNLKLANELLKLKRKKKAKALQESEQQKAQYQMQTNMQSQQAAAEAKAAEMQSQAQTKIAVIQAQSQADIDKMNAEVEAKKVLMELEFSYQMQLKGVDDQKLMQRDDKKEEAKNKRVDQEASRQSKLIDQRKNNTAPIDFESNEDSLDSFDLSSFNPR